LLSAIRQTRQVVIPLWAAHTGLSATANSVIYGVAGAVDALTFYPAGKVMDLYGRRWVAVPCVIIMGVSFVLMPLTHAAVTLALTAMIMGFGNGIGSGIVMTLAPHVPRHLARDSRRRVGGRPAAPVRRYRPRRARRRHHRQRLRWFRGGGGP